MLVISLNILARNRWNLLLITLLTFQRYFKKLSSLLFLTESKLGDEIQEFYQKIYGKVATAGTLTHLRHELAHAIWRLLLDDDLMRAYTDREAIKPFDQIMRAVFPHFLFYSADYPEK